jgi:hypothetical protein
MYLGICEQQERGKGTGRYRDREIAGDGKIVEKGSRGGMG